MLRAVASRGGTTTITINGSPILGGATTQVLFNSGGFVSSSASLTFDPTGLSGGPVLTVGTGTTTGVGGAIGYSNLSGSGRLWLGSSAAAPTANNFKVEGAGNDTYINSVASIILMINGTTNKILQMATAGVGPAITAGTATTDVAALSITRTNNNAAVATGVDVQFTDTASSDTFTPLKIRGDTDGLRQLLALDRKGGLSLGSAILLKNMVSLASGAGAQTGTLLNSPAAGNPAKFLFIRDNGQTLGIPAWIVP